MKEFETTITIIQKRDMNQMSNQEARDALSKLQTPATEIRASLDDILLQLKPEIFIKLCLMSELLITEAKPNKFYIDRMNS
jgi:hypothetical protein